MQVYILKYKGMMPVCQRRIESTTLRTVTLQTAVLEQCGLLHVTFFLDDVADGYIVLDTQSSFFYFYVLKTKSYQTNQRISLMRENIG